MFTPVLLTYWSMTRVPTLLRAEFKVAADELCIVLKCIPTEAHERIGAVQRRHAFVRTIYEKLKVDLLRISPSDRLSLTFAQSMTYRTPTLAFTPLQWYSVYIQSFPKAATEEPWLSELRSYQIARRWQCSPYCQREYSEVPFTKHGRNGKDTSSATWFRSSCLQGEVWLEKNTNSLQ